MKSPPARSPPTRHTNHHRPPYAMRRLAAPCEPATRTTRSKARSRHFVFEASWHCVHSVPFRDRLPRSVHLIRSVVVDEHRGHVALFPVDIDLTGVLVALLGGMSVAV